MFYEEVFYTSIVFLGFLSTSENYFYFFFLSQHCNSAHILRSSAVLFSSVLLSPHIQFSSYNLHIFFFACIWQLQVTRSDLQYIEKMYSLTKHKISQDFS